MILMTKDLKSQNICDLEKCAGNKNQNKDVISEEFMVYEERQGIWNQFKHGITSEQIISNEKLLNIK